MPPSKIHQRDRLNASARNWQVGVIVIFIICHSEDHVQRQLNVAVTRASDVKVSIHVREVPDQAPDQPENTEPQMGLAIRVTMLPSGKLGADGIRVTVPLPDPLVAITSAQARGVDITDGLGEAPLSIVRLAGAVYVSALKITVFTETVSCRAI